MGRLKDQVVCVPIVYGSIAFFLGKKATETETHEWSIYVRGLQDEDLSYFIKKVVFTLHPSCQIPVVTCEQPPYVVTQTGWGEFECTITIVFKDEAERSVNIIHFLRLYPPGVSSSNTSVLMKKPVVYEHYEEILFREPTEEFYKVLTTNVVKPEPLSEQPQQQSSKLEGGETEGDGDGEGEVNGALIKGASPEVLRPHFTKISEVESMKALLAAQTFVTQEIEKTCQELASVQDSIASLKATKMQAQPAPISTVSPVQQQPSKKARH